MTTAREFRAIAEKVNAEKVQRRHPQLIEFMNESILPGIKKKAEAGYYEHVIQSTRGFGLSEVMKELESRGFTLNFTTRRDIRVNW
jgi:hypothetical protein